MGNRLPAPFPWRFLLVDLATVPGEVLACLDPIASTRNVAVLLNQPDVQNTIVPSDDRRINTSRNGLPQLTKNTTGLVCLRRDNNQQPFWTPRSCGVILQLQDNATADISRTTINAWGPDKLWEALPLVKDDTGTLVDVDGYPFTSTDVSTILTTIIHNSYLGYVARNPSATAARAACYIDWGAALGGTSFWGGTIQTGLGDVDITFQLSTMLGGTDGAIGQLIATGACDILITPIWDPVNRPGYLAEGSIVAQAGNVKYGAVFAWDVPPNSLLNLVRLDDGSPGQMVNKVVYGVGNGAGGGQATASDATSITAYGEMWDLQNLAGQPENSAVAALAALEILLAKQGKTVVTLTPMAERAPIPGISDIAGDNSYWIGDQTPVYASNRFRQPLTGQLVRVNGIPFVIGDDQVESVQQILTSADGAFTG